MDRLNRVCVFCGSSTGTEPEYALAARALGSLLAERKIGLVYGGGSVGLMGSLADGAVQAGGEVIGVIPHNLAVKELAHQGISRLEVVDSMHTRKARMAALSDAFVALPGGFGTLEELFEVVTWGMLGIHAKPIGVLDVRGYYDPLARLIDHTITEGFVPPQFRDLIVIGNDAADLLDRLAVHELPPVKQWITPSES